MTEKVSPDIKLGFDDVAIVPADGTDYSSRKDVKLDVDYTFLQSGGRKWSGIPICATNMSTVGTIEVAKLLQQYKMMTFLHKFYTVEEIQNANLDPDYFAVTVGINEIDGLSKFNNIKL